MVRVETTFREERACRSWSIRTMTYNDPRTKIVFASKRPMLYVAEDDGRYPNMKEQYIVYRTSS